MENKDLTLKFMCKALYAQLGYGTHYEIKLRNRSYINAYKVHDVSDIDVYGYRFAGDLTLTTIGAECKSGESSALDELYKFIGIRDLYHLSKAYLIKTRLHQNARQVALHNGMVCLTEVELRKMLLGFDLNVDKLISIEKAKYWKRVKYMEQYKTRNEKIIDYIQLDFWNKENWRNIHNIIHIISPQGQQQLIDVPTVVDKYVMYSVVELFAFCCLRTASEAIVLNYSDFDSAFATCLYGGAEALNEKRRIQDAVNIATQEPINFEPAWQEDLVPVFSRASQATYAASLVPLLVQDIYENSFFSDKVKIDSAVLRRYPDLTRKLTQDIMAFLQRTCGLSEQVFAEFMSV